MLHCSYACIHQYLNLEKNVQKRTHKSLIHMVNCIVLYCCKWYYIFVTWKENNAKVLKRFVMKLWRLTEFVSQHNPFVPIKSLQFQSDLLNKYCFCRFIENQINIIINDELVIFLENQYYITFLPFILKSYMRLCSQITFERFFSSLKSIYLQQEEEKKCASSEHSLKWHLQFQDANDRKMP